MTHDQGESNVLIRAQAWLRACAFLAFMLSAVSVPALAAEECAPVIARVVSVEGRVQISRTQGRSWLDAVLEVPLCPGDIVRVEDRSRAALLLANETTVRLDQRTTLALTGPRAD